MLEVHDKILFAMTETAFENAFDSPSLLNLIKYLWSTMNLDCGPPCGISYDLKCLLVPLEDENF